MKVVLKLYHTLFNTLLKKSNNVKDLPKSYQFQRLLYLYVSQSICYQYLS